MHPHSVTSARRAPEMRVSLSSRRTSPLIFLSNAKQLSASRRCDRRWRPQLRDQPQDIGEQNSGDDDLGHPEGDITAVADDLRANLDQLFLQARTTS
jgi:hypothetical protein